MKATLFTTYVDDFEKLIRHSIAQAVKDSIKEEIEKVINSPKAQHEELLTIEDAAQFLHASKPTIHKWIKNKLLQPYRIGRRIYFKKQELLTSIKTITVKKNPNGK